MLSAGFLILTMVDQPGTRPHRARHSPRRVRPHPDRDGDFRRGRGRGHGVAHRVRYRTGRRSVLSPSHLLLAAGMFLMMSGPLRARVASPRNFTHPVLGDPVAGPRPHRVDVYNQLRQPDCGCLFQRYGSVTAIMLTTGLTMGFVLFPRYVGGRSSPAVSR